MLQGATTNGAAGSTVETTTSSAAARPIWFGDRARPLFGWFHAARGAARDCVVVLCNPFGYDTMLTHYSYRDLAERLARAGIATLRFDYHGTGDSSGEDSAPNRVDAWLADIDAGRDEALRLSGARAAALFGVRVGGLLALASAKRAVVDDLILMGPSVSGRAAVRELRAMRMLQSPIGPPGSAAGASSEDENLGFLLTAPMRDALGKIDPLAVHAAPARRVLIIARDDVAGGEGPLVEHLRACGTEVTASSTPGYSLVLRGDPYTCELPHDAWNEIVAWLAARHQPMDRRSADAPDGSPGPPAVVGLGAVREEAVRFRDLFGILTEPVDCSQARARTAVLLLNIGANHRIGSNRMYVRWARAWAALGFRVLRFDFSGMGDSPARPNEPDKDVYSPEGMKQVSEAMDFLETRGCERFVVGGLCSGAYVAYYAAVEDPRVSGIVAVNTTTFHWKRGDSLELRTRNTFQATSFYKKRAFEPRTWLRALKGEVHVRAVLKELGRRTIARGRTKAGDLMVRLGVIREPDDIARGFQAICRRGCEALLVYGSQDGGLDVMEGHLGSGARKMRHAKTFRLEILHGTDHIFTPREAQDRLTELLTDHLVTRFGR